MWPHNNQKWILYKCLNCGNSSVVEKFLGYTFVITILLLSIKVDYRLVSDIYCCKDDHDYYAHAETIAEDFDFDYDNQFQEKPNQRYYVNGKQAPSGFVGGLLSAPFIYVGNLLNKFLIFKY